MKKINHLTLALSSIIALTACQTVTTKTANKVYGKTPSDYQTTALPSCPTLSQTSDSLDTMRKRLTITPDMVVSWSDENSQGSPRILLILNNKGIEEVRKNYGTHPYSESKKLAPILPILLIGKHTVAPSSHSAITQGFLTLDNLPANWTEDCTATLFSTSKEQTP